MAVETGVWLEYLRELHGGHATPLIDECELK